MVICTLNLRVLNVKVGYVDVTIQGKQKRSTEVDRDLCQCGFSAVVVFETVIDIALFFVLPVVLFLVF